jgi:hypothetical protein
MPGVRGIEQQNKIVHRPTFDGDLVALILSGWLK